MSEKSYHLEYTPQFEKGFKKLTQTERKQVYKKLTQLQQNPLYPSLRTKKVKGAKDIFELSVNMDIRILWKYKDGALILLLEVGHHKNILGGKE